MPNIERTADDSTFFAIMSEMTVCAVSSTLCGAVESKMRTSLRKVGGK